VFAGLFDRHYEAIARFLGRRLERSLADELAAETFLQLGDDFLVADHAPAPLVVRDARAHRASRICIYLLLVEGGCRCEQQLASGRELLSPRACLS
jgi:hypothetical protein